MLYIFLLTLNPGEPKWIGTEGLIGGNPGIGFRPMPDQDKNVESTLIWFNRNTESNNSYWTKELNLFFEKRKHIYSLKFSMLNIIFYTNNEFV